MEAVATIIREVAAAEVMPRFRKLAGVDIRHKGPNDIVTIADEAAEQVLTRRLTDLLPGSVVVGEEAYAADPSCLRRLFEDAPVWVVDPVDGTNNFAQGRPVFAVMVSLNQDGRTVQGWIHDPVTDRMLMAEQGAGARLDGNPVQAAAAAPLVDSSGFVKNRFFDKKTRERLEHSSAYLKQTFDLFCAGHEYLQMAKGEVHFALYRRIMPWDHAAGVLIHGEAGGYAAMLNGLPYAPTETEGGLLLAPDRESWKALRDLLFEV